MTQPIQEPTVNRALARSTWNENQLYRRPAPPPPAGGTTSAYFDDFTWNGTGSQVANATWVDVVTGVGGANTRWFAEACFDPAGDWSIDFATGQISDNSGLAYNYTVWGFVEFAVAAGTVIGAGIDFNNGEVQRNTGTATATDGRIMVSAERVPEGNGISLLCYQASGGADDLIAARLHVRRFELFEGVYTCTAPP